MATGDRHKTPRQYDSGSEKRKKLKLLNERRVADIAQSRCMTDFVVRTVRTLDFTSIIEDFAKRKARRVVF